jgi:Right handed beta helix region
MFTPFIRAFAGGVALALTLSLLSTSRATNVGGMLSSNTTWTAAESPYSVLSTVTVPAGLTLTVEAGVVVRMTNSVSISAQAGAAVDVEGTAENPVQFLPLVGNNNWGTISASGNNAFLTIRQAEITHGGVSLGNQAAGLVEDAYVHDVGSAIVGNSAKLVTMRRVHVSFYSETIFNSGTVVLAEDSLFENQTAASSDALEIQNGPPGSIIRRCTFRHSTGNNSDAVDFNGSTNVFVHDCLIYDISDKGCSFGTATAFNQPATVGIVVSNCLIYGADICVAVKDKSSASLFNNTFADSAYGVRLYQKYGTPVAGGGGRITEGYNNVIWGNAANLDIAANSDMAVSYSDIGGTTFPGTGNISADPKFLNPPARDYRLAADSPASRTGLDGGDMGAQFPVGAPMALSHPRLESAALSNGNAILRFWADSEKSYTLQMSDALSGGSWTTFTNVPIRALPVLVEVKAPLLSGQHFFRLQVP